MGANFHLADCRRGKVGDTNFSRTFKLVLGEYPFQALACLALIVLCEILLLV